MNVKKFTGKFFAVCFAAALTAAEYGRYVSSITAASKTPTDFLRFFIAILLLQSSL